MMDHQFDTTSATGLHERSARAVASSSTPRIDARAIAQSLTGAKKQGNGWVACCPAHDDRTPSLSIIDGEKGPVWTCRAGCSNAQVTAALQAREIWTVKKSASAAPFQPATPKPKAKPAPDWVPMVPPPENAPAPDAREWRGYNRVHEYRGQDGELLFYVRREEATATTKKQFHPLVYGELTHPKTGEVKTGWHMKHADTPRPLYRLDALAARPDATVLLCEGEKSTEAAQTLFPDHVAMTWPGGSGAVAQTDWTPLHDRQVIIWPDNDQAGHKAATQVQNILPHASIIRVDDLPNGHDAADVTLENPADWLADRVQAPAPIYSNPYVPEEHTTAPLELVIDNTIPGETEKNWTDYLQLDERGKPLSNHANALTALRGAPQIAQCFAYDEMLRAVVLTKPLPKTRPKNLPRMATDIDVAQCQEWLQRNELRSIGKDTVHGAVDQRAHELTYHPVRRYLEALQWDGTPRLATWVSDYLGVTASEYTKEIGRMFLIAMVARVMRPGCKADYMMILEGPQGAFKSTACKILGGEWFDDNLPADLSGKEASHYLRGKWLVEIPELSQFGKTEATVLKAFVTRAVERYRPPFGRKEVEEPRQCLFIGTTNKTAYLRDETGARRFWPVTVGQIATEALKSDRDQLFAEATALFKAGAEWWPSAQFQAEHITKEQEARYEADAWEGPIIEYVQGRNQVRIPEIAFMALQMDKGRIGTSEQRRIAAILEREGWERDRDKHGAYFTPPPKTPA